MPATSLNLHHNSRYVIRHSPGGRALKTLTNRRKKKKKKPRWAQKTAAAEHCQPLAAASCGL